MLRLEVSMIGAARPTVDQTYRWRGYANGAGDWVSSCRLRIYTPHPEQVFVVLDGSPDNEGTTVTNCAEYLLPLLAKEFDLDPVITVWLHLEHGYDSNPVVSQMTLTLDSNCRRQVCWSDVPMSRVEVWLGGSL
jgi:hypothetical protein